jgi:hypothetical protein
MPGILEESLLALRMKQPVYVIGAFGGASQVLGELLGLSGSWPRGKRKVGRFTMKPNPDLDRAIRDSGHVFRPAGYEDLPLTYAETIAYISGHAIAGSNWPDNGLSVAENRELFKTRKKGKIVELIIRGLSRRFSNVS